MPRAWAAPKRLWRRTTVKTTGEGSAAPRRPVDAPPLRAQPPATSQGPPGLLCTTMRPGRHTTVFRAAVQCVSARRSTTHLRYGDPAATALPPGQMRAWAGWGLSPCCTQAASRHCCRTPMPDPTLDLQYEDGGTGPGPAIRSPQSREHREQTRQGCPAGRVCGVVGPGCGLRPRRVWTWTPQGCPVSLAPPGAVSRVPVVPTCRRHRWWCFCAGRRLLALG